MLGCAACSNYKTKEASMRIIVEYITPLEKESFGSNNCYEIGEFENRSTKYIEIYEGEYFRLNIGNPIPCIEFQSGSSLVSITVVRDWDIRPTHYVSRVWLDGVCVFDFSEYHYSVRKNKNGVPLGLMYLRDK